MVTYPSTHGVYESNIRDVCAVVHECGGQVYLDGANLNALVGLAKPGKFGADVSHLNLHKTFCIPHGGGGPGRRPGGGARAPRAVPLAAHRGGAVRVGGHPADLVRVHPADGRRRPAARHRGRDPHRQLRRRTPARRTTRCSTAGPGDWSPTSASSTCARSPRPPGVTADDVAKRLIDFGFHAPTMSFPVAGTLMVEPTESEDLAELDRFCDAMIAIRDEIRAVEAGEWAVEESPLRLAPHPAADVVVDRVGPRATRASRPRSRAASRLIGPDKYWPPVSRIDGAFGDRNLDVLVPAALRVRGTRTDEED